jgi:hypothetical protein
MDGEHFARFGGMMSGSSMLECSSLDTKFMDGDVSLESQHTSLKSFKLLMAGSEHGPALVFGFTLLLNKFVNGSIAD